MERSCGARYLDDLSVGGSKASARPPRANGAGKPSFMASTHHSSSSSASLRADLHRTTGEREETTGTFVRDAGTPRSGANRPHARNEGVFFLSVPPSPPRGRMHYRRRRETSQPAAQTVHSSQLPGSGIAVKPATKLPCHPLPIWLEVQSKLRETLVPPVLCRSWIPT